jgi:uncharacterized Zn finger protein
MAFGRGGYSDYPAYVPVAQRLSKGLRKLERVAKQRSRPIAPVKIEGRHIATSFWGKAWCDQLEAHSDYANRLPRGRTYVRNGSVLDLHVDHGKVEAYVAGSELYSVTIKLTKLAAPRWQKIIAACAGRIGSLIGLLRGELSDDVLAVLTDVKTGVFPAPREIALRCSCPDGASMCKHVAAALYGVGARLDQSPELFFVLRQVDQSELMAGASVAGRFADAGSETSGKKRIASSAVASVFGIELDEEAQAAEPPARKKPVPRSKQPAGVIEPTRIKAGGRTSQVGEKSPRKRR